MGALFCVPGLSPRGKLSLKATDEGRAAAIARELATGHTLPSSGPAGRLPPRGKAEGTDTRAPA